jgi:SAM-dependent methyltransferase
MRRADLTFLSEIRADELGHVIKFLPPTGRILDFGAGPGHQALRLQQLGFDVEAVDVESSTYTEDRVFPVRVYDGRSLPYPDGYFDVVMSSNVLDQIADLPRVLAELTRVLRPGGTMLHVTSSASWRLWTMLAGFPAAPRNAVRGIVSGPVNRWARAGISRRRWMLMQLGWIARPFMFRPHGATGCALTELWTFSRFARSRAFATQHYDVVAIAPLCLWYTGEMLLGARLPLVWRGRLARWLGSSAILYVLRSRSNVRAQLRQHGC